MKAFHTCFFVIIYTEKTKVHPLNYCAWNLWMSFLCWKTPWLQNKALPLQTPIKTKGESFGLLGVKHIFFVSTKRIFFKFSTPPPFSDDSSSPPDAKLNPAEVAAWTRRSVAWAPWNGSSPASGHTTPCWRARVRPSCFVMGKLVVGGYLNGTPFNLGGIQVDAGFCMGKIFLRNFPCNWWHCLGWCLFDDLWLRWMWFGRSL